MVFNVSFTETKNMCNTLFYIRCYWTVNTKVDMRFNVGSAYWLSERVREKILQMVCVG